MNQQGHRFELLAFIAAVLIALQARVNGELSHLLGNSTQAALISFGSGLIVISIIAVFSKSIHDGLRKLRAAVRNNELPWWTLFAGMLGGAFVAVQTMTVVYIGVAMYTVASIAGQTIASLVVDKLGITGMGKQHLTPRRLTAAFITIIAVFIAVYDRIDTSEASLAPALGAVAAGVFVGVQRALHGMTNKKSESGYTTSFINFIMGTAFLIVFLIVKLISGISELEPLPSTPWWIYTGGVIGVIYIAITAMVVSHMGVLNFTLLSVGGQLIGSILIDFVLPTNAVEVTPNLLIGIALTYCGVIVGGAGNSRALRLLKPR